MKIKSSAVKTAELFVIVSNSFQLNFEHNKIISGKYLNSLDS